MNMDQIILTPVLSVLPQQSSLDLRTDTYVYANKIFPSAL